MANQDNVTLKAINKQTLEKKDKTGTFEAVELIATNGKIFNGYATQLEDVHEGDTVTITSQDMTKKDGSKYTKILSVSKGGEDSQNNQGNKSNKTWSGNKKSSFDNKSAREGGAMHDAVAIAIHNAVYSKTKVNLDELNALFDAVLDMLNRSVK